VVEFTRILCPIDLSDTSKRALSHAAAFARWYKAELIVTHVMPRALDLFAWTPDMSNQLLELVSPSQVLDALRRAVADQTEGIVPRLVIEQGHPDEEIARLVKEEKADLLVLGTHGRRGFNHLFLGSVAEKVIRSAACPVLTVPPAAPSAAAAPVRFQRILCPVDESPSARRALDYALELGREAGGTITVLRVLEYMDPTEASAIVDPAVRAYRKQVIEQARERLQASLPSAPETWCEIEPIVALDVNRAGREILRRAAATNADLIVMGAQGSGGAELMVYGSNTHHVVRSAGCPVLTVRA
jgi:nucleotide-binding universal stress UspA family protein